MTLRDDYEHWARSFPRRMGEGWGVFLDAISALSLSDGAEAEIDHVNIQSIGSSTHDEIDTHLGSDTGHPNTAVNTAEPTDESLNNNEAVFWHEP